MIDIEAGVDKDGNRFVQVLQDRWLQFIREQPLTAERYQLWEKLKADYLDGREDSND
jgi:hypothetical protein